MDLTGCEFDRPSLTALTEASAAVNSTLELSMVLQQIARRAAAVARAEASSVLTYHALRRRLIFAAAVGARGEVLLGREFEADLGIAGRVLKSGRPLNVADVSTSSDFYDGIDALSAFQTRGLMAAPMIYQSETIGVIEVLNPCERGQFSSTDLELLTVFANLAACAARNARTHDQLRREHRALRESLLSRLQIIGASAPLREMLKLADRVATTNATVLLLGETGTGKELIAKYIHDRSERRQHAFVAVNCAALPETLLESELFGHEKGAFTGAIQQHLGRFELADGGTLFLDEIGDISASTQVKLLRLLQEHAFTRVGGTKTISCDVRVIAATNRNLKKALEEGRFRDDLYYRLNVFPIHLPPLRERREDVPALAEHFAALACQNLGVPPRRLAAETVALLVAYDWPGNIRELCNIVERAVLMCDGTDLLPAHLPADITGSTPTAAAFAGAGLWATERAMIVNALREARWNKSKAARALGISRDNLRYRLKKYNISDREE